MKSTQKITKGVIAVAGSGTRFLPATKSLPKEMLPIVDKPIIHYVVEEMVEAGDGQQFRYGVVGADENQLPPVGSQLFVDGNQYPERSGRHIIDPAKIDNTILFDRLFGMGSPEPAENFLGGGRSPAGVELSPECDKEIAVVFFYRYVHGV